MYIYIYTLDEPIEIALIPGSNFVVFSKSWITQQRLNEMENLTCNWLVSEDIG